MWVRSQEGGALNVMVGRLFCSGLKIGSAIFEMFVVKMDFKLDLNPAI